MHIIKRICPFSLPSAQIRRRILLFLPSTRALSPIRRGGNSYWRRRPFSTIAGNRRIFHAAAVRRYSISFPVRPFTKSEARKRIFRLPSERPCPLPSCAFRCGRRVSWQIRTSHKSCITQSCTAHGLFLRFSKNGEFDNHDRYYFRTINEPSKILENIRVVSARRSIIHFVLYYVWKCKCAPRLPN